MAYTGLAHGGTPIPPPLLPCPVVSCHAIAATESCAVAAHALNYY